MSNKEIEEYLRVLDEGLAESEKLMLQEKAANNEDVINADSNGKIVRIPAKDIIAKYPQYQ